MINVEKNWEKIKNKYKNAKKLYDNLLAVSGFGDNYIQNLLNIH